MTIDEFIERMLNQSPQNQQMTPVPPYGPSVSSGAGQGAAGSGMRQMMRSPENMTPEEWERANPNWRQQEYDLDMRDLDKHEQRMMLQTVNPDDFDEILESYDE